MTPRSLLLAAALALTLLPPVSGTHAAPHMGRQAGGIVGGRPPGCPYQFCGCGASLEVFGRIIPALNRAAAWFRFPRAVEPKPGMVAVRTHHVFVLKRQVSGDLWLVKDYNSGGHLTRLHVRSIRGFTIVRP